MSRCHIMAVAEIPDVVQFIPLCYPDLSYCYDKDAIIHYTAYPCYVGAWHFHVFVSCKLPCGVYVSRPI